MKLINWLINFFNRDPEVYEVSQQEFNMRMALHDVYDPSQDEERILKGEIESYFD